jgi:hypothetical protein
MGEIHSHPVRHWQGTVLLQTMGGVQKSKFGRSLNGRTYNEMPRQGFAPMPSREQRQALLQALAPLALAEPLVRLQTPGDLRRRSHA